MKNMRQEETTTIARCLEVRRPYLKPEIKRVELALEETMSAGCKLNETECTDFPPLSVAGS